MRILHVLDHSIPIHSGYSVRTRAILEHQRARGWHTEQVTSLKHHGARQPVETVSGLRFHRTLPGSSLLERFPGLRQVAVITTLTQRLGALIPELKPDLLHAHSPSLIGVAAVHAARRARLPVVYEVRALWEEGAVVVGTSRRGGFRYRVIRGLENYVLRRCDAVTTICEGLRRELVSRGVSAEKVTVVANGVDLDRFNLDPPVDVTLARQLGVENTRVLGFVGSLNAYEGLATLVGALPVILRRHPRLRLMLVGGGQQEESLRRQASASGVSDAVILTGQVAHDDVQRYYGLMDMCVYPRLPSRALDLTTPLKPLEAMAQGKLVVASDVGGNRELIADGETGVLFRAGDRESLTETLLRLLEDKKRTDGLRQAARRYVERERAWPQLIARYEDVYTRALRGRTCQESRIGDDRDDWRARPLGHRKGSGIRF